MRHYPMCSTSYRRVSPHGKVGWTWRADDRQGPKVNKP